MPNWTPIPAATDIQPGTARSIVIGDFRLAAFRTDAGSLHVTDLSCPHQGYPLTQGAVDGCTLTCAWHNYRFDLRDGACLKGDEALRTWATQLIDGVLHVDLTPPDPAAERDKTRRRLQQALHEGRLGQVARELVRLQTLGVSPRALLVQLAADDGHRAEWGTTHVLPMAAESLPTLRGQLDHDTRVMMVCAELLVRSHTRRAAHPPVPAADHADLDDLLSAVRAEDESAVLATLAAGLRDGAPLGQWVLRAAAEHHLSFGHGLIYALAVGSTLEHASDSDAAGILAGFGRSLAQGTREDRLPAWRPYRKVLDALDDSWWPRVRDGVDSDTEDVFDALIRGRGAEKRLLAHFEHGTGLDALLRPLARAAVERVLRFDPAHDANPNVENNWLDVTHVLTFTEAVARATARLDHPASLRLLLQAARFISLSTPLDGERDVPDLPADPVAAMRDAAIDDSVPVPIVAAHVLKTAHSAARLQPYFPDDHDLPLAAAWRFATAGGRQRWVGKRVHEAIELVSHGRTPRSLTG